MSDTKPDIEISKNVYVDVNSLAVISVGTAMIIENKSTSTVRLQLASTQPSADTLDGSILYPGGRLDSIKLVSAGENKLWAKSFDNIDAIISAQENV